MAPEQTIAIPVPLEPGLCVSALDFELLCAKHPDLRLERTSRGELIVMAPAGSESGRRNAGLTAQLWLWNNALTNRGVSFDSSAGFTLPNGAIRAPDSAWIKGDRWNALEPGQKQGFAHICPDFVAELRSISDSKSELRAKMSEYISQGARLGWLIDPIDGEVEIYRPGMAPERLVAPKILSGEDVLPGFILNLADILRP